MQRHIDAAYDAWKEADAAARELLGAVHEAWYRYDMGLGVPPSSELVGQAAGLRHEASEKLARAIQMLHDAGLIQPAPKRPSRPRLVGGLQFGRRFQ